MINYNNFSQCKTYKELNNQKPVDLKKELTVERISQFESSAGADLRFNYGCSAVNESIISQLQECADEQQIIEKYKALLAGERINTGEDRKVLHQLSRGECAGTVEENGKNLGQFYKDQLERFSNFAKAVHSGEIKGSTGKPFTQAVQIGIGGSDLGPRAMYLALKGYAAAQGDENMQASFISNVDPDDANDVLANMDFETTLFILVSKSGTTQETLTNQAFVIEKIKQAKITGMDPALHMIAVTSETSPLAASKEYMDSFYIDDYIGGRYSSCSAVGGVVLSLAFTPEIFKEFLEGAHQADMAALNPDINENAALMDAMIGVFQRLHNLPSTAVLPYSQALSRFPAHLQQMDMESNGKSINRDKGEIDYLTGPAIFGEPGTNGQHSFYQLLHQGTDTIPLQFIGFKESQRGFDLSIEDSTSQKKLNANLTAQIIAFALGQDHENLNKRFAGNRYSTLLIAEKLTPAVLGALLAHFENKVMFQGFVWNVNSFDQEGVQLGKLLTKQVLEGDMPDTLQAYADKLGL